MKRFLVYAITGLFLVIYSCKSLPSEGGNSIDYDFKFDLYSHVKWYYRANLKYPSVGELKNFCWKIIDVANDNTFSLIKKEQDVKICCNIYPCIRMIFHLK